MNQITIVDIFFGVLFLTLFVLIIWATIKSVKEKDGKEKE